MRVYKKSHAQRLKEDLEDAIVNGRLRPGERLDADHLGERYAVSRTPIREAIQQLASSGLVNVVPKRGTFVAELGITQLIEMFEVMAELEGMAGRLAARRITEEQTNHLRTALQACRTAAKEGDSDRYYYENEKFHYLIYEASQNTFLTDEARRLHGRLKPYRRLQLRVRNRVNRSLEEHCKIVDAILAGDEDCAEEALQAHILVQGARFNDLVASIKTLESDERISRDFG